MCVWYIIYRDRKTGKHPVRFVCVGYIIIIEIEKQENTQGVCVCRYNNNYRDRKTGKHPGRFVYVGYIIERYKKKIRNRHGGLVVKASAS